MKSNKYACYLSCFRLNEWFRKLLYVLLFQYGRYPRPRDEKDVDLLKAELDSGASVDQNLLKMFCYQVCIEEIPLTLFLQNLKFLGRIGPKT